MRNFNEILRKDVIYGNIKSNKKTGLNHFSQKHNFGKTTGEADQTDRPSLFRIIARTNVADKFYNIYFSSKTKMLWVN